MHARLDQSLALSSIEKLVHATRSEPIYLYGGHKMLQITSASEQPDEGCYIDRLCLTEYAGIRSSGVY